MPKLHVAVIGLGKQSKEDHLPAIKVSNLFKLVGLVDSDPERLKQFSNEYHVPGFSSIEALLSSSVHKPDVAVVAIPHTTYPSVIKLLAENSIHIIKEKPFATSMKEANEFKSLSAKYNIGIYVTLQRRFNPIFFTFNQLKQHVGAVFSIEGRYTMNIARLDEGWRAQQSLAAGGALIDMGYHFVDLLIWYYGLPDSISCKLSRKNRGDQKYDVEDTAAITFTYNDSAGDEKRILGSMLVSRVYPQKEESLTVYGSLGSVQVQRGRLVRRDLDGNEVEILERQGSWPSAAVDQLEQFGQMIIERSIPHEINPEYLKHIAFVEAAYASNDTAKPVDPRKYLKRMKV